MDAGQFYKTPVKIYQTKWRHTPENNNLNVNTVCESKHALHNNI
jgi:hypothetical protein